MTINILFIGLGGALGAISRYGVNEFFINYLEHFHQLKKDIQKDQIIKLYYLKDDVHFNEEGNKLIFQKLIDVIKF